MKKLITTLAAVSIAAGCTNTELSSSDCADAAAHLQACMPSEQVVAPDSCTPEMAADILDRSCAELRASEAATRGKADGCNPWFWWTCTITNDDSQVDESDHRQPGLVCGADMREGDFETWRGGDVEDIVYGDGYVFAALTDWQGTLDDSDDTAIVCAYELDARASLYEEHCFIAEQPETPWDRKPHIDAMAWEEGLLYVAVERGLYVYDVTEPAHPVWVGEYLNGSAEESSVGMVGRGMEVHEGIVYIAGGGFILDARDPSDIRRLWEYDRFIAEWTVVDGVAYAVKGDRGIATYDVSDPANPHLLDSYMWSRPGTDPNIGEADFLDVTYADGFIYAAVSVDGIRDDRSGLWVFDARDPSDLRIVHQSEGLPTEGVQLVTADGYLFVAYNVPDGYASAHHEIGIWDIADPANPVLVDNYDDPSGDIKEMIVADGNLVYSTEKFGSSAWLARDGVGTLRTVCE
jgi:hypothetical protein